jgi:PAS domain S-box-containing protein
MPKRSEQKIRTPRATPKTKPRRKQDDTRHSHRMFLQSIEDSPSAISIVSTDLQGSVIFWNKGAENLLGYTAEEMVGVKIGILYPEDGDTRQTVGEVARYILNQKKGTTCEIQETTKDGRRLWVRLTLSPRFTEEGEVIGILGIGENVTERRMAEHALAERVRLAALAAEVGSAIASADTLPAMMRSCTQAMVRHLEASYARIWVLHSGDKNIELLEAAHNKKLAKPDRDFLPNEDTLIWKTVRDRQPQIINDIRQATTIKNQDQLLEMRVSAIAAYPLIVETRMMGVMTLFGDAPITEAARHALSPLAGEIALGIERIWSYSALLASEGRLRSIFANAMDGIVTASLSGAIESFNPAAEKIFGYGAQEVFGKKISLLLNEAPPWELDPGQMPPPSSPAEGESKGKVWELAGRRKDGSRFALELAVSELQMPERRKSRRAGIRPILRICMIRDITERKRFETALKEERDYTANIIEKTPSLICGLSLDGITHFANPGVEKSLGYAAGELIGKNWWRIFFPGDRFKLAEPILGKLRNGPIVDYELEMTTKRGTLRMISWTFVHRPGEPGEIAEVLAFGTDITVRKKAENELILAAQRAEESNRIKSEFISTVSHELRTPLNVMLGNTPLLTDPKRLPPPAEIIDIVRDIDGSGKHLLNLIDDLLDFSKIEARKMTLNWETVSARDLVHDVISGVVVMAKQKNLLMETAVDNIPIACDAVRMKQILFNLLSNAIKFTDHGGVRIEAARDGDWVRFHIKDTGCGIAEDDIKYIFDVFRQVDSSFTRAASGSGLGLAITKSLVELHGGNLSAESKLGVGTVMTFTLPCTPPTFEER